MRMLAASILALACVSGQELTLPLVPPIVTGGLTTLFACDPLCRTLSLADGTYGTVVEDGQVKNRDSHIELLSEDGDVLSVGVQGGDRGAIVDLGSGAELARKYRFHDTVGNVQGFTSIRRQGDGFAILGEGDAAAPQALADVDALATVEARAGCAVKIGHIYLVRVALDGSDDFSRWAKVLVVGYVPGQSVTLRWESL